MNQKISSYRKTFFLAQSTVLASLMLFVTQNHAEPYYKWVDSKGSTHYTTTPPPKGSKKQGQVDTYGHLPHSAPNNESGNPHHSQPDGDKTPNTPQITPKPEQTAPSTSSSTNRATV